MANSSVKSHKDECFSKFHCENNILISAIGEIKPEDVEDYLSYRIKNGYFLKDTTFCVVTGININYIDGEVILGQTDFNLIQGFDNQVFNGLRGIKNEETEQSIWKEMNFKKELIPIACEENFSLKPPFAITYELSKSSKLDLENLAKKVANQNIPYVVILACSYSFQSSIKDIFTIEPQKEKLTFNQDQPKPKSFGKFHSESNSFITTTDEINAQEVLEYLTYRIKAGDFFEGTTICTVAGIHHGKDRYGQVVPGKTDYALLQGFFYKVFNGLNNMKDDKSGKLIWNEMNFKKELIAITCDQNSVTGEFELSENSKADLKDLARKLVEQTKPYIVLFASCFSYQSTIRDFLVEQGVLATLDITNDRGKISGGRIFALDKVQREVQDELREVKDFVD